MTFAIVIGSYSLTEFVRLNIRQCRVIFGDDVPILVSDDLSAESPAMAALASEEDVAYVCPKARRSHFSGDWQAIVNASEWASSNGADIALKLSQRLIPLHPEFKDVIVGHFANPKVGVVVPGRIEKRQLARPEAGFYSGFGHLSDLVAFRPAAMPPAMLIQHYREKSSGEGKARGDRMVEVSLGKVFEAIKGEWEARTENSLANHLLGRPRIFARKSQSNRLEYVALAEKHGLGGTFNLSEWSLLERQNYLATGPIV